MNTIISPRDKMQYPTLKLPLLLPQDQSWALALSHLIHRMEGPTDAVRGRGEEEPN